MLHLNWLAVLAIVFVSGLVKGTSGFGFALFSFPLLVHFIPVKTLIPILTLLNLFSSSQIVLQTKEMKLNKRILFLSFIGVVGVVLGSFTIKYVSAKWLKFFVSFILVFVSVLFLTGYRFKVRKLRRGNAIAGLVSGFLGGSTSISGPPLALFLTSIKLDSAHFRFTFAWFSIFTSIIAIFDYLKIGIVYKQTFVIFAAFIPVLLLSVALGKIIGKWLPQKVFFNAVILLTLLSGLYLFFDCFIECVL